MSAYFVLGVLKSTSWPGFTCLAYSPTTPHINSMTEHSFGLKVTTCKLRVMFYWVGIFRTSSPGDSFSSNFEKTAPQGHREESGYMEVCNKGKVNIKRLLFIMENQISQVKEFSAFLYMGRLKSLGLLKLFLSYASQLSGTRCSGGLADGCQIVFLGCPLGSEIHIWRAGITDCCDILISWYSKKYSISQ